VQALQLLPEEVPMQNNSQGYICIGTENRRAVPKEHLVSSIINHIRLGRSLRTIADSYGLPYWKMYDLFYRENGLTVEEVLTDKTI
jgi:hypothetical protein